MSSPTPTLKTGDTGPTVELWQQSLADAGYSPGATDGQFGAKTEAATKRFETDHGLLPTAQVGEAHWQIIFKTPPAAARQPAPSPDALPPIEAMRWPEDDPASLANFYGRHEFDTTGTMPTALWERRNLTQIRPPWPMVLSWDKARPVLNITCHKSVARSLVCVLDRINRLAAPEQIRKDGLNLFGGCYCYRPRRTSARLSLHAYGAAIDLDPDRNAMGTPPKKAAMPGYAIEAFEAAGWRWGGNWKNPDPMHFEAAR